MQTFEAWSCGRPLLQQKQDTQLSGHSKTQTFFQLCKCFIRRSHSLCTHSEPVFVGGRQQRQACSLESLTLQRISTTLDLRGSWTLQSAHLWRLYAFPERSSRPSVQLCGAASSTDQLQIDTQTAELQSTRQIQFRKHGLMPAAARTLFFCATPDIETMWRIRLHKRAHRGCSLSGRAEVDKAEQEELQQRLTRDITSTQTLASAFDLFAVAGLPNTALIAIMRLLKAAKALRSLSSGASPASVSGDGARTLSTSGLKDVLAEKIPKEQVSDSCMTICSEYLACTPCDMLGLIDTAALGP